MVYIKKDIIEMKSCRNHYFDFLKGIAIIMVVGIHTYPSDGGDVALFIRQIQNIAVPLFIACSGFFLAKKDVFTKASYLGFVKKQVPKVYLPMLFWALPIYFLQLKAGEGILITTLWLFIGGLSIYYFIFVIVQFYFLLPCFKNTGLSQLTFAVLLSVTSILLVTYVFERQSINLIRGGFFSLWIAFFSLGVFLGRKDRKYPFIWMWMMGGVTLIALIASFFEAKYLNLLNNAGEGQKLSSFIYSFAAIFILFSHKAEKLFSTKNLFFRFISFIGEISFGIYLTHCYYIIFINKLDIDCWVINSMLVLMLTIFIIYFKNRITSRFTNIIGF